MREEGPGFQCRGKPRSVHEVLSDLREMRQKNYHRGGGRQRLIVVGKE